MKKLEDLKTDLLNNKVEKFYIFYGNDVGIRQHYINKISTYFQQKLVVDNWLNIKSYIGANSLISGRKLILIYNDEDFLNQESKNIENLIYKINNDFSCIFVYDLAGTTFKNTNLFKYFADYITEFQAVQSNIALEFIADELPDINELTASELAYNCENLYSNILLEADKIKSYQNETGVSQQVAFESLKNKNQLLFKQQDFVSNEFMNCVLQGNFTNLSFWYDVVTSENNVNSFFKYLSFIFNDFMIAGLVKKYGYYDGGSRAFRYKMHWGRIIEIRNLNLIYNAEYYFVGAYKVANIDELVKNGTLKNSEIIDYFFNNVI